MSAEIIYTDGACSKNGTANATGGFGMFISKSSIFASPLKINQKGTKMTYNEDVYYVTNIRMEGLAIVSTMALYADALILNVATSNANALDRLNSIDPFHTDKLKNKYSSAELKVSNVRSDITVEIVTDSLFWINVAESWMPSWIKKGILLQKKNPDILLMLHYYMELFSQNGMKVKLTHVRSHQKGTRTEHADGNDVADVLATSAVHNSNTNFQLV